MPALAFSGEYLATFVDVLAVPAAIAFLALEVGINSSSLSPWPSWSATAGATLRVGQLPPGAVPALAVLGGAIIAYYSFVGFETSANVVEEIRNPSRVYPRALVAALAAAGWSMSSSGSPALIAVANGALLTMIMASRLSYGMAEQGLLPGVVGAVLPNRRTPWVAIVATAVVAMVLTTVAGLSTAGRDSSSPAAALRIHLD